MTTDTTPALECSGISVNYGPVAALKNVAVAFAPHMIHAVVGQNGAGKTTFARVVAGIVRPDTGSLLIGGKPVPTGSVHDARAAGVELVHQSFALPPSFTVAEALEYGSARPGGLYSRRALERRWTAHLESLGVRVRPRDRIRDLPVEMQQGVEIARALVTDAKVLILDEPTAVLSPSGIETLFDRLRGLKEQGVTIILILHKIREVLGIADTVTVLRGGLLVEGPTATADTDARRLAHSIIGSAEEAGLSGTDEAALVGAAAVDIAAEPVAGGPAAASSAQAVVEIAAVSTRQDSEGPALADVSLTVGRGEIVGVAGVEGNGQRELGELLSSLSGVEHGSVSVDGRKVPLGRAGCMARMGVAVIPEDRHDSGCVLNLSLADNLSLDRMRGLSRLGFVNRRALHRRAAELIAEFDIQGAGPDTPFGSLSGGNQQRAVLARELSHAPKVLVAAQPTRGLDVGAIEYMTGRLRAAAAAGIAVLLVSTELEEILDLSHRIVVLSRGRVIGELDRTEATEERLGMLLGGIEEPATPVRPS